MMPDSFINVVVAIIVLQITLIVLNTPIVFKVKAGDKDDYHFCIGLNKFTNKYINDGGQIVDVPLMPKYVVAGRSMTEFNVKDGQTVIIEPMSLEQTLHITDFPILLYKLENKESTKPFDSKIKLRKFVGYIGNINDSAEDTYEKYKDRIKVDKGVFVSEFNQRKEQLSADASQSTIQYILSETFSERLRRRHYSIHAADNVEGHVKYVI